VAKPSPSQVAWRRRIEAALRLAAPFLDLVLVAGDRVSRLVEREDPDAPPPLPAAAKPLPTVGPGGAD